MDVVDLEIERCDLFGAGGFVQLRRCTVRNCRADGSRSAAYALDLVERPGREDAVVILPWHEGKVLLRRGLRPALRLARSGKTREGVIPPLTHLEAVAGLLEPQDEGAAGVQRRAALELQEETGLTVDPGAIQPLGPPMALSPGLLPERLYFCHVCAPLAPREEPRGDGSPLEEGSEILELSLDEALERCRLGEVADTKTEVALRRLHERLS